MTTKTADIEEAAAVGVEMAHIEAAAAEDEKKEEKGTVAVVCAASGEVEAGVIPMTTQTGI